MEINNNNGPKFNLRQNVHSNYSDLKNHMKKLESDYRSVLVAYESDPSHKNLEKLLSFMHKMQTFLETHKDEIFAAGKQNGWPLEISGGEASYPYTYESLMSNIKTFLNPSNHYTMGGLDYINEQFTQLNFFLDNGVLG